MIKKTNQGQWTETIVLRKLQQNLHSRETATWTTPDDVSQILKEIIPYPRKDTHPTNIKTTVRQLYLWIEKINMMFSQIDTMQNKSNVRILNMWIAKTFKKNFTTTIAGETIRTAIEDTITLYTLLSDTPKWANIIDKTWIPLIDFFDLTNPTIVFWLMQNQAKTGVLDTSRWKKFIDEYLFQQNSPDEMKQLVENLDYYLLEDKISENNEENPAHLEELHILQSNFIRFLLAHLFNNNNDDDYDNREINHTTLEHVSRYYPDDLSRARRDLASRIQDDPYCFDPSDIFEDVRRETDQEFAHFIILLRLLRDIDLNWYKTLINNTITWTGKNLYAQNVVNEITTKYNKFTRSMPGPQWFQYVMNKYFIRSPKTVKNRIHKIIDTSIAPISTKKALKSANNVQNKKGDDSTDLPPEIDL